MLERGRSYLRLVRAENCLMAAFVALIGTAALPSVGTRSAMAALTIAGVLAAGNAVNDLMDIELDKARKASRPMASGALSVQQAKRAVVLLTGTAFIAASATGGVTAIGVVVIASALSFSYSILWKGYPLVGNVTVGLLAGCVVLYGAYISQRLDRPAVLIAVAVGSAILALEILKTIEDRFDDAPFGLRTVGTTLSRDAQVSIVTAAVAVSIGAVVALGNYDSFAYVAMAPLVPLGLSLKVVAAEGPPAALRPFVITSKILWLPALCALALIR